MAKNSNRGPNPTPLTIHMLCAHAAGRCQFKGCNKYLFSDEITLEDFNNSNVAHIVASSPDGPRGDILRSHQLSQSLDNLMLMCLDHHKLVDTYPEKYTEEVLLEMKRKHEQAVFEQCSSMYAEPSEVLMVSSPIKGRVPVGITFKQAAAAITPAKRVASSHGMSLSVNVASDYKSQSFWDEADKQLTTKYRYLVQSALSVSPNQHFSVFPIAPIPLIVKLGYLMGDKVPADIFQKTRTPDTWQWQAAEITNSFTIVKETLGCGNRIALALSLTADIAIKRITDVSSFDVIYFIKASRFGVDCINSIADLSAFWHAYQDVCDEIKNTYTSTNEIAVFPAIPVSAAFEVGRRYMPSVYPALTIYDNDDGFFKTLTIGGRV